MKFSFRAYDRAGKAVSDVIDAATAQEAEDVLRKRGLFVSEVLATRASSKASGAAREFRAGLGGRGKRLKDMAVFVRQLSVLVSTGTPMVDAISSIERQLPKSEWRTALESIRKRIEEGSPFSVAVESQPKYFDGVARSLIAAGESGGQLDQMLKRLASLTRQQLKVRASVLGALAYPCVLVFISLNVLGVMLFFVLPRFEGLFQALGSPLPPTTRLLMDLSALLRAYWWAVLAGAGVLGLGTWSYLGSQTGRRALHSAAVTLPLIGRVSRALITARLTRVLGVLLAGRVPMLEALSLTRQATGNVLFEDLIAKAEEQVTKGENVSSSLADSSLLSRSVVEAMRSGERSGQLSAVLLDLSDFLDEDNDIVLRSLSSVIEPIILLFLGVVIGFVAVSMFLPLFDLATATRGGGS